MAFFLTSLGEHEPWRAYLDCDLSIIGRRKMLLINFLSLKWMQRVYELSKFLWYDMLMNLLKRDSYSIFWWQRLYIKWLITLINLKVYDLYLLYIYLASSNILCVHFSWVFQFLFLCFLLPFIFLWAKSTEILFLFCPEPVFFNSTLAFD